METLPPTQEAPRPYRPTPNGLDALELRRDYLDALTVFALANTEEARLRRAICDHEDTIKHAEIRATLSEGIDGKTAEVRRAQVEDHMRRHADFNIASESLRSAKCRLVIVQGSGEVARERCRLYRALLATLATGVIP